MKARPGISVTKAADHLQMQDRIIKSFPEVASVFGKAGRASTATDPAPTEMYETVINLKPKGDWSSRRDDRFSDFRHGQGTSVSRRIESPPRVPFIPIWPRRPHAGFPHGDHRHEHGGGRWLRVHTLLHSTARGTREQSNDLSPCCC